MKTRYRYSLDGKVYKGQKDWPGLSREQAIEETINSLLDYSLPCNEYDKLLDSLEVYVNNRSVLGVS